MRGGGADTKDELVEMLCSKDGIEVRNMGSKSIAELEEFVGFKIESVAKYYGDYAGGRYRFGSVLKKGGDKDVETLI